MLERHNGIELDPEGAFVYYEHAQQAVERFEREVMEWKRALHSLTPGGSKYANDSKACVEWVREARSRQHDAIVDGVKQRKDLQAQLAAAQADADRCRSIAFQAEPVTYWCERAQAAEQQVAQLREYLQCLLANEPLSTGEYVHHVACDGDRSKPAGTPGVSCSCQMVIRKQYVALQTAHTTLRGLVEQLGVPDRYVVSVNDHGGQIRLPDNYVLYSATSRSRTYALENLFDYIRDNREATLPREGGDNQGETS